MIRSGCSVPDGFSVHSPPTHTPRPQERPQCCVQMIFILIAEISCFKYRLPHTHASTPSHFPLSQVAPEWPSLWIPLTLQVHADSLLLPPCCYSKYSKVLIWLSICWYTSPLFFISCKYPPWLLWHHVCRMPSSLVPIGSVLRMPSPSVISSASKRQSWRRAHLLSYSALSHEPQTHIFILWCHHRQRACLTFSFWIPMQVSAPPPTLSPRQKAGVYPRFLFSPLLLHLTHWKLFPLLLLSSLWEVSRSSSQGAWIITVFWWSSLPQGSPPASSHTVTRTFVLEYKYDIHPLHKLYSASLPFSIQSGLCHLILYDLVHVIRLLSLAFKFLPLSVMPLHLLSEASSSGFPCPAPCPSLWSWHISLLVARIYKARYLQSTSWTLHHTILQLSYEVGTMILHFAETQRG